MKKVFTICVSVLLLAAGGFAIATNLDDITKLFDENVEALAATELDITVIDVVCKVIGCCGGDKKCFTGTIKGVSGTFYME